VVADHYEYTGFEVMSEVCAGFLCGWSILWFRLVLVLRSLLVPAQRCHIYWVLAIICLAWSSSWLMQLDQCVL